MGKSRILLASFGGNPRAMHQSYLDVVAIVARFGKPDYFSTMTASPNWVEVRRNLRPVEAAADRALVARIPLQAKDGPPRFNGQNALARTVAYTWVVEFQKKGLPQTHIVLIVTDDD